MCNFILVIEDGRTGTFKLTAAQRSKQCETVCSIPLGGTVCTVRWAGQCVLYVGRDSVYCTISNVIQITHGAEVENDFKFTSVYSELYCNYTRTNLMKVKGNC